MTEKEKQESDEAVRDFAYDNNHHHSILNNGSITFNKTVGLLLQVSRFSDYHEDPATPYYGENTIFPEKICRRMHLTRPGSAPAVDPAASGAQSAIAINFTLFHVFPDFFCCVGLIRPSSHTALPQMRRRYNTPSRRPASPYRTSPDTCPRRIRSVPSRPFPGNTFP